MEFGDNMVKFNIFKAMKHPIENHSILGIEVIDYTYKGGKECSICVEVAKVATSEPFPPSTMQPLALELKPLLEHLKYAYLEHDQTLLVIIATNLQSEKVVGWTVAGLLGINPSICMHSILLEEEARLMRQP
ncbi:hypothetical protein CR513_39612, partial [Mucuna pruriens]